MVTGRAVLHRILRRAGGVHGWLIGLLCFVLAGCGSGSTTPVGPLGTAVDLRSSASATVAQRFPTNTGTESYSTTQQVCNTPGSIQFNWHVVAEGNIRYIVSFDAAVVQSVPNYEFTVLPLAHAGMFDAENGINSQTYEVAVDCKGHLFMRETRSTFLMFIRADGNSEVH